MYDASGGNVGYEAALDTIATMEVVKINESGGAQDKINLSDSLIENSSGVQGAASVGNLGNGVDVVNGSKYGDVINGDRGNDTLKGLGGDDTISGGRNRDTIDGGDGNDTLNGDEGRDTISGGSALTPSAVASGVTI